jgi:hypothetical protein
MLTKLIIFTIKFGMPDGRIGPVVLESRPRPWTLDHNINQF